MTVNNMMREIQPRRKAETGNRLNEFLATKRLLLKNVD